MSDERKPREWTILLEAGSNRAVIKQPGENAYWDGGICVIEKSAYDDLKRQLANAVTFGEDREKSYKRLYAENQCLELQLAEQAKLACRNAELYDEVKALIEKLAQALKLVDTISRSEAFIGVFQIAQIHGMPYRGGQYGADVSEAIAAYNALKEKK